jgi:hypothetical protein
MMETINGFGRPLAAGHSGKLRATAGVGQNLPGPGQINQNQNSFFGLSAQSTALKLGAACYQQAVDARNYFEACYHVCLDNLFLLPAPHLSVGVQIGRANSRGLFLRLVEARPPRPDGSGNKPRGGYGRMFHRPSPKFAFTSRRLSLGVTSAAVASLQLPASQRRSASRRRIYEGFINGN